MTGELPAADHAFDGGDMDCGSGLILLIREHMLRVPAGGVLEILSSEPTVTGELPPWCRMTGHTHLASVEEWPGRWRHFVRRGAAETGAALEQDKQQARRYEWRVRARHTGAQEATVFARNFSWRLGQPASFEERDSEPSALEALLGALAADVMNAFATGCARQGVLVDELEATSRGTLHNVLAHLGMEEGDPSLAAVDLTVFITSPAPGEVLRGIFAEVLERSILYRTLHKAAAVQARLAIQ